MASVPEWKILNRSRRKPAELIARYVRAEEVSKDSGLKGVGFLREGHCNGSAAQADHQVLSHCDRRVRMTLIS